MKVKKETLFPKTKIQWLWENMKGRRVLYVIGMLGTVVYNIATDGSVLFRKNCGSVFKWGRCVEKYENE